jgi:hypothetical protein
MDWRVLPGAKNLAGGSRARGRQSHTMKIRLTRLTPSRRGLTHGTDVKQIESIAFCTALSSG